MRTTDSGTGRTYPHEEAPLLMRARRRLVQPPGRVVRHLGIAPGDTVLELGPGPGYFSKAIASRVQRGRYLLFDLQDVMLRSARSEARPRIRTGSSIDAIQGDASALPFATSSIDIVFVSAVLGEVAHQEGCLAECLRVLRPGGRLAVSEMRGDDDFIPRDQLRALVQSAGFSREQGFGMAWNYTDTFLAT